MAQNCWISALDVEQVSGDAAKMDKALLLILKHLYASLIS
jgi:hypothetical protein